MAYQAKESWCGPAALQNALRILGVRLKQEQLASLLWPGGDAGEGVDEQGLLRALGDLKCSVSVLETSKRSRARAWVEHVSHIGPILMAVDDWDHWVCVGGGCADRLWLLDSTREEWNTRQNGVWPLTVGTVLNRWRARNSCHMDGGLYYGIALLSCDASHARARAKVG